jgi:hypothetical protein
MMSIYEKRLTHGRPGRGGMSGHPEREGGEGGGQPCSTELGSPNSRFRVGEFPSFRGPSVGLQRDPKVQIPCFEVCRLQDTPLQIPDSEFPSFRDPSVGPQRAPKIQIPRFLMGRFQDTLLQIPRFRVCRFQDTPGHIPDSEFPSFRGPLLGPRQRDSQIPDSEFPSFRGPRLGPSPRDGPPIPDSEFPSFRGPLFGPRQRDSQIPDSEFPSFRGPLLGRSKRDPQIPRFQVSESYT